ncbi:hypothetical protein [Ensifer soli]|uniref:hypothetical protein n=1 Tax=Ciceribacter sp. sgz301302 TaxID=3342379 RepID=UPI0035BA7982
MKTPQNIVPYVEILGETMTVELLLALGGSPVYLADNPQARSDLARIIGQDNVRALAQRLGSRSIVRIPINRPWIAHKLRAGGMPVVEIARTLHVTDVTVRAMLSDKGTQLTLPL